MKTVYLSLGSNVGDRERSLQGSIDLLGEAGLRILRSSPVYETEPLEYRAQGWFLNLVLEAESGLFPLQLLHKIQRVEKELGRRRTVAKGPRSIDIDILLFGKFVVETPELVIPHPKMHERRFVLEPMAELAPDLRHPVLRRTMRDLLAGTQAQVARRVEWTPRMRSQEPGVRSQEGGDSRDASG